MLWPYGKVVLGGTIWYVDATVGADVLDAQELSKAAAMNR